MRRSTTPWCGWRRSGTCDTRSSTGRATSAASTAARAPPTGTTGAAPLPRRAEMMLADIDKDTVDFGPNFDDSTTEPLVLPTRFPNLLVNGSAGIAVGMATNVPPHHLGDTIES